MDKIINHTISTYHGNYLASGKVPERGGPHVPIEIEALADCVRLRLGDLREKPGVMIERQTDRWLICIAKDDEGDNDLMVYIMDNGKIVAVPDYDPSPDVSYEHAVPAKLPWSDVKYKDGLTEPA